jgi:hypothetical protein
MPNILHSQSRNTESFAFDCPECKNRLDLIGQVRLAHAPPPHLAVGLGCVASIKIFCIRSSQIQNILHFVQDLCILTLLIKIPWVSLGSPSSNCLSLKLPPTENCLPLKTARIETTTLFRLACLSCSLPLALMIISCVMISLAFSFSSHLSWRRTFA